MTLGDAFPAVLAAARSGADWAWDRLYRDLAPLVLGYVRGRGSSDPEDLLGEVFLQVVRSLPTFEGDERQFRSWLLTIAHRRVVDEGRRRARRPIVGLDGQDAAAELELPARSAEEEAADALEAARCLAAIRRLRAPQRDVLLLRLVADLDFDELGRVLGKRQNTVKQMYRRAMIALRKNLGDELYRDSAFQRLPDRHERRSAT